MSLRELCRETELSMGGIYSCIESKEMIAIMVKDMVKMVSSDIIDNALRHEDKKHAPAEIVTHHIFAAELLHPWFYFLYFETRSLPGHVSLLKRGFSIFINDFQSGLPENNCPSHHTVPASIASRSVSDKAGNIFLNMEKKGPDMYCRLSGFIKNVRHTSANTPNKVMSRPCSEK